MAFSSNSQETFKACRLEIQALDPVQEILWLYTPFVTFYSTRSLETHLGGLQAACIGPALSKFRV